MTRSTKYTTHESSLTGAVDRDLDEILDDTVNVKNFGADPTGVVDSTAAFNLASLAAETYGTGSNLDATTQQFIFPVIVPEGVYKIDGDVYIRKGSHLLGMGQSSHVNLGATGTINIGGMDSGGFTQDAGGLPVGVSDMFISGGAPGIHIKAAGAFVRGCFFNAPSTNAITLEGNDALIEGCIFDDGSTHVAILGSNNKIQDNIFFKGNTNVRFSADDSTGNTVHNCTFEFADDRGVDVVGKRCYNNTISGCSFFTSDQTWFADAAIYFGSNSAEFEITGCKFRNLPDWCILHNAGSSVDVLIKDCSFDARVTKNGDTLTTTMKGVKCNGSTSNFRLYSCEFLDLPGQPIEFEDALGGTATMRVESCTFDGTTGGNADISILAANFNSLLELRNINGSGRALIDYDATANCDVISNDLDNWIDDPVDDATDIVYTVPFVGATLFEYSLWVNTDPGASARNRQCESGLIAVELGDISATLSTQVTKTATFTSSGLDEAAATFTAEMTSKGTGSSTAIIDRGDIVLYHSNTYADYTLYISPIHRSKKDT